MITSSICEYSVEQGHAVLEVGALWQLLAPVNRKKILQGFSMEFWRYLESNNCPMMWFLTNGYNVALVISNTDISKYFQFLLHFNSCYLKLLPSTLVENASHFCNNIQTNNYSVNFMFSQTYMSVFCMGTNWLYLGEECVQEESCDIKGTFQHFLV